MIVNLGIGRSSPRARVNYLLYGSDGERAPEAVHLLEGNPNLFVEIARNNPYKVKTYNYLISFSESKEELEKKLAKQGKTIEDLYQEVVSFLLPAEYYPREALNILAVAHSDTDNFHIHLTIENYDHLRQTSLYIPKNKTELDFYRALESYISVKYGLSLGAPRPLNKGKAGKEKVKEILLRKGEYRNKQRDEIKEELTSLLTDLVLSGDIETREDLIAYLDSFDFLSINRIGKHYISLKVEGISRPIRLKGGIYDEGKFNELKEHIRGLGRKERTIEGERRVLEEVKRKREKYISERRKSYLCGLEAPYNELSQELSPGDFQQDSPRTTLDKVGDRRAKGDFLSTGKYVDSKLQEIRETFVWRAYSVRIATRPISSANLPVKQKSFTISFSLPVGKGEVESLPSPKWSSLRDKWRMERMSSHSPTYTEIKLKEALSMRVELREIRELELDYLKNLHPKEVLPALGIRDWKERKGYILLRSPLREDKHPSFQAYYTGSAWIYMDFGTGWKGTSIDLWQEVKGVDYITAVREMREYFGINLLEEEIENLRLLKQKLKSKLEEKKKEQREHYQDLKKKKEEEKRQLVHKILKVVSPSNPALLEYLKEREITSIPDWLKEIHYYYQPKKKSYFSLAVKDENGVWHARNPYSKVNIKTAPDQQQTFSYIKNGGEWLVVVEGLFDALTLYQLDFGEDKKYDIVILNSVVNADKLIRSGIIDNYKSVILALDNDEAGRKTEEEILNYLKSKGVKEVFRLKITDGKDLNECLMKGGKFLLEEISLNKVKNLEKEKDTSKDNFDFDLYL